MVSANGAGQLPNKSSTWEQLGVQGTIGSICAPLSGVRRESRGSDLVKHRPEARFPFEVATQIMRVLALVPSIRDTSPGQRYRIEQWQSRLEQSGVEITLAAFEDQRLRDILYAKGHWLGKGIGVSKALARRLSTIGQSKAFDLVYLFREAALIGPSIFERLVKLSRVPLVFDFDDAIFVRYRSPANGWLSALKAPGKTRTICRLASHVMVGNDYLAEYARRYNRNVTVIPTTIDTDVYRVKLVRESATPVIGWTGSYSTIQHLDLLRPILCELARRQRFRLRVIGASDYKLEGVDIEVVPWRSHTEAHDLAEADIGIMPLPNDPWSRGKCGCKALQYMGLGIPAVCSPVGMNTDLIRDGDNGFLANNQNEWITKLTLLLRFPELRKKLGLAGRKTVEERFSASSQVPRVHEVFRSVIDRAS
jgi:glycosyltransferase involved in cell wall biosynthesis